MAQPEPTIEQLLKDWPVTELARAASGSIDIEELAHYELACRGLNKAGEDVGHECAAHEYMAAWG